MKRFSEPGREEWIRSFIYIGVYVLVIGLGAFWLLPKYWFAWGLAVLGGAVLLVGWHRAKTIYQCPNCGHIYDISFLTDFFAPHGVGKDGPWLLLKCPSCNQRSKTKVLVRED